jgi:hypothetical protein
MASLREYFVKAGAQTFTINRTWTLANADGTPLGELTPRLHLDFDAHAKYVSFFIPEIPAVECPEALALDKVPEILKWDEEVQIQTGHSPGASEFKDARELVFTGQIYLYSERPVSEVFMARLIAHASAVG